MTQKSVPFTTPYSVKHDTKYVWVGSIASWSGRPLLGAKRSSDSKPEGDRFKSYPRNHFHYNSLTVPV